MPLPATDTRLLFRPLCGEIVDLLRALGDDDWERPTIAGAWRVRDIVAHLLDTALRRLSFHRDGWMPPAAAGHAPIGRDLVALVDTLNATWTGTALRLSPRVLTSLYSRASTELADFVETLNPDAEAVLPVSWAGQTHSPQWLDIGREFTEVWHHGSQIRDAVGAGAFSDARWLRAVLQIAMHAVPEAYRDVSGRPGLSMAIHVTGHASGIWTLCYRDGRWDVDEGDAIGQAATATMSDEVAWRLFFNALPVNQAETLVSVTGDAALARPLLRTRSAIV